MLTSRLRHLPDEELLDLARQGDRTALDELHGRHYPLAIGVARRLTNYHDAEDIVSEAFAGVLQALDGGRGPTLAYRPYLLASVRRAAYRHNASARRPPANDILLSRSGSTAEDEAIISVDKAMAAAAFATLPERWQTVLVRGDVEGQGATELAEELNLTPNAVSALSYRAREALRQAFLVAHITPALEPRCRRVTELLGAYVRQGTTDRQSRHIASHLESCDSCLAAYLDLCEINYNLRGLILLGAAGAGLLGFGVGSKAGRAARLGRARKLGRLHHLTRAGSLGQLGAAATAAAAVGVAAVAGVAWAATAHRQTPVAISPPSSAAAIHRSIAPQHTSQRAVPLLAPTSGPIPAASQPGNTGSLLPPDTSVPGAPSADSVTSRPLSHREAPAAIGPFAPTPHPAPLFPTEPPTSAPPLSAAPTVPPTTTPPTTAPATTAPPTTAPPTTAPPTTAPPTTAPPTTAPPTTVPPTTVPPTTAPPTTVPPTTTPPTTVPPTTAPPTTAPPTTAPPTTGPPTTVDTQTTRGVQVDLVSNAHVQPPSLAVTVTNQGPGTATHVTVTLTASWPATFVVPDALPDGWSCTTDTVRSSAADPSAGHSSTMVCSAPKLFVGASTSLDLTDVIRFHLPAPTALAATVTESGHQSASTAQILWWPIDQHFQG